MTQVQEEFISFLTEDQQAGGLWPEGDKGVGTVVDLHYETGQKFGREGKYTTDKPQTMAITLIRPADGSPDHEEITSIGDATRLVASPDKDRVVRAPNAATTGLSAGGNWAIAMSHLENHAGKDFMRAFAKSAKATIVGKVCEFISIPQPDRNIQKVNIPGQKAKRPGRILLINKIDVTPATGAVAAPVAGAAPAAAPAASAAAAPAPAAGAVDVAAEVGGILMVIAAEAGEAGVAAAQLPGLVSAKIPAGTDAKTKGDILRMALNPVFLKTQNGWKFEGGKISL